MIESGDIVSWAGRSGHYSVVGTHEGVATVKKIGEMVNKPSYNANVSELTVVQKYRSSYRYPLTSSILRKAILAGAITPEQAKSESIIEAAENIAYEHKDDEEVGSSDMTFILKEFLDEIGVETYWENNRLSIKKTTKMEINFNSFTLDQFESFVKSKGGEDIDVTISEGNNIKDKAKTLSSLPKNKFDKSVFSIGDIGKEINIYKGNENIYADFVVYDQDNDPFTISLFSKENHEGLKEITEEIVEKFARGGGVKSKKIDYNKLAESNVWGLEADDIRKIEEETEYDSPGHWKFNKVNNGKEYEAVYDGLYMHVFGSLEDLMARQNEIAYYEYDEAASDENEQETFVDSNGNEREYTTAAKGRKVKNSEKSINEILQTLKKRYASSENTSGEFIIGERISGKYTESEVKQGVRAFLEWDNEGLEDVDVLKDLYLEKVGDNWVVREAVQAAKGRSLSAINKDRRYFNKNEEHERRYAEKTGRSTRSYNKNIFDFLAENGKNVTANTKMPGTEFFVSNTIKSIEDGKEVRYDLSLSYNKDFNSVVIKETDYKIPTSPYTRSLYLPLEGASTLYSMLDKLMHHHVYGKANNGATVTSVWNITYFDKDGEVIDQTQIDEKNEELAWELFAKFGHTKEPGMYIEWEEENDPDEIAQAKNFKKGGFVGKGELVWGKLSKSKRGEFLQQNFTPEITPRSQELMTGRDFKFLPKKVKTVLESKYANVEEYSNGGGVGSGNYPTYVYEAIESWRDEVPESWYFIQPKDVLNMAEKGELYAFNLDDGGEYEVGTSRTTDELQELIDSGSVAFFVEDGKPEGVESFTINSIYKMFKKGGPVNNTTTMRTEIGTVDVYSLLAFPLEEDVVVYYAEKSDKKGKSSIFWIVNKEDADMLARVGYTITKVNVAKGNRPYSLTTGEIGTKMAAKGRSLAAVNKDRKYFNKSEDHEVRYAEKTGRDTKSYNKSPKHLVIKNVDNEMFVETEKDGEVTYTSDLKKATTFTIGDEDSEADAHSTLALLNETYEDGFSLIEVAADGAKISKQEENDYYHILDVEQRLVDGEVEINGKALSPEEAKEYLFKHMSKIIKLGRKGWNPFDTIYIIEGDTDETDNPEAAEKDAKSLKAADGAEIDEMVNDWKAVKKALGTKAEGYPRNMKVLDIESNTVHKPILIDYDQETVMMESEEFGRAGNSLDKVMFFFDDEATAPKKEKPSVLSPSELMRQKTQTKTTPIQIPATTQQSSFSKPLKTNIPYQPGKYNEALKKVWQEAKGTGVVIKSDEFMEKIEEAIMLELSELVYKEMLQEAVDYLLENQIVLKSKPFMKNIQVVLQD